MEAIVRLAIPRGAAVTDAALWIDGQPRAATFVERERARTAYESVVERRRDPALVTWDGAGFVAISIFPLAGTESRRFELEWIEPAAIEDGFVQYRAPTLAEGERLVARATVDVDGRTLEPGSSEIVQLAPAAAAGAADVLQAHAPGDPFRRVLVRAPINVAAPRIVLVAETSAAMRLRDRAWQQAALDRIVSALPDGARVTLLAADWLMTPVVDQADPAAFRRAMPALDAIASAGALHMQRLLDGALARASAAGADAVVFVGRGADAFPGDPYEAPVRRLRAGGVRVLVMGAEQVPRSLADAAALSGGDVLPSDFATGSTTALVREALAARPPPPAYVARGIDRWWPLRTATGGTVWLARTLEPPHSRDTAPIAVGEADAADLLALWDRARIATRDAEPRATANRVAAAALTPLRALLVLETDADYHVFGLKTPDAPPERKLAEEQARSAQLLRPLGKDAAALPEGALGIVGTGAGGTDLGTLGPNWAGDDVVGASRSGYGRGAGGLGGRRSHGPEVTPGQFNIRGTLDKEIVRRVVRRHLNEVRYCYEQALLKQPGLGGWITLQLTIGASGSVIATGLQSSTIGNSRVEACVQQAMRRWEFPPPVGGALTIASYQVVFTPADAADSAARTVLSRRSDDRGPDDGTDGRAREALAILGGRGPLSARVERVAAHLGLDPTSDPENAAWSIQRDGAPTDEVLLAARLLAAAGRRDDAIRVLSERAVADPAEIAAELRRMHAGAEAAMVLSLAARGSTTETN
jgi:hypothetical protein